MFHSVARVIVGREVNQECVLFKLGRAPHRHFCPYDLFDVFDECGALTAFWSKRVDHDVILLAVDLE